ncbi:CHAD domain-containing protein [Parasporobacterium paucivorans]|uniref:Phosphohistidine phosphatase SixA n=1 Tax=Parasporobacterium paucivorans DSM 15970 TaxID=1122934 RepID=A0A1M6JFE6_9FIRM|nr:CHAD domain-containing protein [Parasporobacterium paucivorans]SHJ45421.1 phosphohistidine phosphatase SixA [Parasporobacterium paucivorans DSM 15970]
MYGKLILMRHGKAQGLEPDGNDAARELTRNGINELKAALPGLQEGIGQGMEIRILSSPLIRAVQTAQILARELGDLPVAECEWIKNGDFEALKSEIQTATSHTCLIIIGHEPFLSGWATQLYGLHIPFRKGMAVSFAIESLNPIRLKPHWLIQPDVLEAECVNVDKKGNAVKEFHKIFRAQFQEIFDMYREISHRIDDPESVHQMRVKIRIFRSTLSFAKPLVEEDDYMQVKEILKNIMTELGHLREIDVMMMDWQNLIKTHPEIITGESSFLHTLRVERDEEKHRVNNELKRIAENLLRIWGIINEEKPESEDEVTRFEDFTEKHLEKWSEKVKDSYESTDFKEISSIHPLRIQIKKLRYVMSALGNFIRLDKNISLSRLKILQDDIGIVCDAAANYHIIEKLDEKYKSRKSAHESAFLAGYQQRRADEIVARYFDGVDRKVFK